MAISEEKKTRLNATVENASNNDNKQFSRKNQKV
jgi:hypothetical protein